MLHKATKCLALLCAGAIPIAQTAATLFLVETNKPYKIMYYAAPFDLLAILAGIAAVLVALATPRFLGPRWPVAAPLVVAPLAPSLFSVLSLFLAIGRGINWGGDFGIKALGSSLLLYTFSAVSLSLGLAAVVVLGVNALLKRPAHRANTRAS